MNDIILQTNQLSKKYGERWAVKNLNLEIHRGDVFGFLGPNGAGKSTTIRMILSLIKPTTGDTNIFQHSLQSHRSLALQKVGGIVEKPDFYLYLSAQRNLEIVGALNGGASKQRIDEVLHLVGLSERARDRVKTFSHGMKQRLGIAQALLSDPELIILDEPTNGLDPQGMKEIRDLILHLANDRHKTIILSSHLLSEVQLVANRMAIINNGELIVQGEVKSLLEQGERYVLMEAQPLAKAKSILSKKKKLIKSYTEENGILNLNMNFDDVPKIVSALVRGGVSIKSVMPRHSLEDYFLAITENAGGKES
ncbi:MAG TPA: ABC transporter ATP-binding protein [Bacteroidota bacterium]|nr:ABC transporter ATP-binding protein [Bacteroidota bacterium]